MAPSRRPWRLRTDAEVSTVEFLFSPLPAHVRTARLVAAATARRSGVEEPLLDEVRLAVGEACSRAVGLHRQAGLHDPVVVRLELEGNRFSVEVEDAVRLAGPAARLAAGPDGVRDADDGDRLEQLVAGSDGRAEELELSLAVIVGLVDDVDVTAAEDRGLIRMSWPARYGHTQAV